MQSDAAKPTEEYERFGTKGFKPFPDLSFKALHCQTLEIVQAESFRLSHYLLITLSFN